MLSLTQTFQAIIFFDFPGYDEKLEKARKTGAKESVICGECKMNGIDAVLCVMDPTFMMGSMGVVTGEKNHPCV